MASSKAAKFVKNVTTVCEILGAADTERSTVIAELYDIAGIYEITVPQLIEEITTNSGIYSRMGLDNVRAIVGKKFKVRGKNRGRGQVTTLPTTTKTRSLYTPPPAVPEPKWRVSSTSLQPTASLITDGDTISTPNVVIYTAKTKAIIDYLVNSCTQEVGWLGTVQTTPEGYLIDAIYVPTQTVHATETDIGIEAMTALAEELFSKGKDPGTLYYWGHSHVNMGVSPSAQDERQVREYLDGCPVFIREIRNKKGEVKLDIYLRDQRVVHQCVPHKVAFTLTAEEQRHLQGVIDRNVHQSTTTYAGYAGQNWRGY